MISLELVSVGWAIVIGCTKKQFQTANLLKVNYKLELKKRNISQVLIFQNVLMDFKILKEKKNLIIFVFWNLYVLSILFWNLCVFPISYTCLHVISYKCKCVISFEYVEIISRNYHFFSLEIKPVSNKLFSLQNSRI
jgi:hypothetical protein